MLCLVKHKTINSDSLMLVVVCVVHSCEELLLQLEDTISSKLVNSGKITRKLSVKEKRILIFPVGHLFLLR